MCPTCDFLLPPSNLHEKPRLTFIVSPRRVNARCPLFRNKRHTRVRAFTLLLIVSLLFWKVTPHLAAMNRAASCASRRLAVPVVLTSCKHCLVVCFKASPLRSLFTLFAFSFFACARRSNRSRSPHRPTAHTRAPRTAACRSRVAPVFSLARSSTARPRWPQTRGGRSHIFRLRPCSKIVESGSA